MLTKSLTTLLALPAILRVALAQTNTSSTACNNSPSLCDQSYGDVTYLGAHDSPFLRDESTGFSVSGNQFFDTTVQLAAGVRLVSAQVQRVNGSSGDLHVCHTSCDLLDAGTLSSWLGEIRTWMDNNPNDVVTVLLVNGAEASADEIASHYTTAGITADNSYIPTGSNYETQQWPTLRSMIDNNRRLVNFIAGYTFTSTYPHLLNEFSYVFENSYDNSSPTDFSCAASRPDAATSNSTSSAISAGFLPLMNHFLYQDLAFGIQSPNQSYADVTNAPSGGPGNLGDQATRCQREYGRRPSYVLVDFFNVGPAIETVDRLNGVDSPVGRRSVSEDIQMQGAAVRTGASGMLGWVCLVALVAVVML